MGGAPPLGTGGNGEDARVSAKDVGLGENRISREIRSSRKIISRGSAWKPLGNTTRNDDQRRDHESRRGEDENRCK
jgi:hypothetical protein